MLSGSRTKTATVNTAMSATKPIFLRSVEFIRLLRCRAVPCPPGSAPGRLQALALAEDRIGAAAVSLNGIKGDGVLLHSRPMKCEHGNEVQIVFCPCSVVSAAD